MTAHHTGKQVFIGDTPVADAYSEEAAARIVAALNAPASIAAYHDKRADQCRQRAMSRAFRIAADDVRAGLWEDADNG